MAEKKPTLNDHLKTIATSNPIESYGLQIADEVRIVGNLAEYLFNLDPLKLLPNAVPLPQQPYNRDGTIDTINWTIPNWNNSARTMTEQLRTAMDRLTTIPRDQQDSSQRTATFSNCAASFVTRWNYLIPIMHAIAGRDPTSQVAETLKELQKAKDDSEQILHAMRDASGQVGLSKESTHFKAATDQYQRGAVGWLVMTIILSVVFLATAILTLLAYRWEPIAPKTTYESVQFVTGKVIVFAILSYGILLCARSYFANKHNAVVNRHRQNALLTYQALVEAAKDTANRDVVLQQAAACIFGPQSTGFTKEGTPEGPSAKSLVELVAPLTKP